MFNRFTHDARTAVIQAQEQARGLHHDTILAEHLLLALLSEGTTISAGVLREHHVRADRLLGELAVLGDGDRDALHDLGIDLAAVRQRAEAAFGPGALDRPRPRRRGLLRRLTWTEGHLPFSEDAKRALQQSLRQAVALHHHSITADHILLGLLADDQDPAARMLDKLGASPTAVREQVQTTLRTAA